MTQPDWPTQLTVRVVDALRRYRKERGLSAQDVADACAALGHEIPRSLIANLENGRRASIDLAEFLVLARVLDVPPVALLFPPDSAAAVEVLPGQTVSMWDAIAWVTGEDEHLHSVAVGSPYEALERLRNYQMMVLTTVQTHTLAKDRRQRAAMATDPAERAAALDIAANFQELAKQDRRDLLRLRDHLRVLGVEPPPLPPELAETPSDPERPAVGETAQEPLELSETGRAARRRAATARAQTKERDGDGLHRAPRRQMPDQ